MNRGIRDHANRQCIADIAVHRTDARAILHEQVNHILEVFNQAAVFDLLRYRQRRACRIVNNDQEIIIVGLHQLNKIRDESVLSHYLRSPADFDLFEYW